MRLELTRRYSFNAAHRLHSAHLSDAENQRIYGKCNNPYGHGHNYVAEVTVTGPLGELPQSSDLTRVPGRSGRAEGQVLNVMGRVLNLAGEPVRNAKVEVWQANAYGRYTHPNDTNPAPLDPNFVGSAELATDSQGRYRFKTIKPAAYPAGAHGGMMWPGYFQPFIGHSSLISAAFSGQTRR